MYAKATSLPTTFKILCTYSLRSCFSLLDRVCCEVLREETCRARSICVANLVKTPIVKWDEMGMSENGYIPLNSHSDRDNDDDKPPIFGVAYCQTNPNEMWMQRKNISGLGCFAQVGHPQTIAAMRLGRPTLRDLSVTFLFIPIHTTEIHLARLVTKQMQMSPS